MGRPFKRLNVAPTESLRRLWRTRTGCATKTSATWFSWASAERHWQSLSPASCLAFQKSELNGPLWPLRFGRESAGGSAIAGGCQGTCRRPAGPGLLLRQFGRRRPAPGRRPGSPHPTGLWTGWCPGAFDRSRAGIATAGSRGQRLGGDGLGPETAEQTYPIPARQVALPIRSERAADSSSRFASIGAPWAPVDGDPRRGPKSRRPRLHQRLVFPSGLRDVLETHPSEMHLPASRFSFPGCLRALAPVDLSVGDLLSPGGSFCWRPTPPADRSAGSGREHLVTEGPVLCLESRRNALRNPAGPRGSRKEDAGRQDRRSRHQGWS